MSKSNPDARGDEREVRVASRATGARAARGEMSRREFARRAALAAGAAALAPAWLEAGTAVQTGPAVQAPADSQSAASAAAPAATPAGPPPLSPDLQAEAEARVAVVLRRYGDRLSEDQKAEIRRLIPQSMSGLESFRKFPLGNSDEPATVLRPDGMEG